MSPAAELRQRFFNWALRGRALEAAPIILNQRRVFVLPTRFGLAFAVLLLVMLIGAVNYQLSLGYALVFLLAGLGIVAIFHSFRNLAQLRISPGRAAPVFAGETARFELILDNPGNREKSALSLHLPGQSPVTIDVPARASVIVPLELPAPSSGWLSLPVVSLQTSFPLGLIRAWAYAAPMLRCLIYPAPALVVTALPMRPLEGSGAAIADVGMEDFAGLRSHQISDPIAHVAWKTAARLEHGPLLSKQFDAAMAQSLWLNWDDLPGALGVEARLSLLARWICDAHQAGAFWALSLPGANFPLAGGAAHFHACLKALALHE